MNYKKHYNSLKVNFPKIDLLKESEFNLFNNPSFAKECIDYSLKLCNHSSNVLEIDLLFGVQFNQKFNASAIVKSNQCAIIFNLGLIDELGIIISNSFNLFMSENIAQITINSDQKKELKSILIKSCINYLFYHELGHIIQLTNIDGYKDYNFQEYYVKKDQFQIKNHIYELDADYLGAILTSVEIMGNIINNNYKFNPIILFNSLASVLFTIANIIIEFSGSIIKNIYYMQNSHPHPFIRILKLNEHILGNIHTNLNLDKSFFEATLERVTKMISQIKYSDNRTIDYSNFYFKNSALIESYIDKIETEGDNYEELTRNKSQDFLNKLIRYE